MDLDDIDDVMAIPSSSKPPAQTTRFAPKNAKFTPRVKSEPAVKPKPEKKDSVPAVATMKTEPSTSNGTVEAKPEPIEVVQPEPVEAAKPEQTEVVKPEPMEVDDGITSGSGGGGDEIVREIDVYFNPSIGDDTKIYVVQYPLRPQWRPYELDEQCQEVRVKPGTADMEIDLSIDVDSNNFNKDCDNGVIMTKQTLSSFWKPTHTKGYAVGVLMGNKLHLNPINAVVQLRPSLKHLSSSGSKRKTNVSGEAEVNIKVEESSEPRSAGHGPSKKQAKKVESSTVQEQDADEDWLPLEYHGSKSDLSGIYLEGMVSHESAPINFTMSPYDYVNSLCPQSSKINVKQERASRRILLTMPLDERIKKLLLEAPQVHRYSALKHYAPDVSDEEFLKVLQKNARLVQGCWVLKSMAPGVETLVRDYTLLLFSKSSTVNISKISLQKDLLKIMKDKFLVTFAIERPLLHDWKFKQQRDASFIKRFPHIVEEQENTWRMTEGKIMAYLKGTGESSKVRNVEDKTRVTKAITSVDNKIANPSNSDKTAKRMANGAVTGRRTMSDETREALPKALLKILQEHKVCSLQLIRQHLRDLAVSQSARPKGDARMLIVAADGADAPLAELVEVVDQVAIEIHGLYVLKSSPDHPEHDPLRKVVMDLFIGKGPNSTLKKAEIYEAAKMTLKREIAGNEYTKVVNELCVSKGGSWSLKGGGLR